jgi:hypothetical protein
LHGTGTEDYFNTVSSPQQRYSAPYHDFTLGGSEVIWSASVSRHLVLWSTEP